MLGRSGRFRMPRFGVRGDCRGRGLSRFLGTAQAAVGLKGEVDVLLAGDRTLRRLNREYRGKDKATDVLSFPAAEELAGRAWWATWRFRWRRRSGRRRSMGILLRDEVRVLLLHGLLHLSGMDHEADRGEMAEREGELRGKLRLPNGLIARVEGGQRERQGGTDQAKAERKAKGDPSVARRQ